MSLMTAEKLQSIIEAALMIAGHPLTVVALQNLFNEDERPSNADIKTALSGIRERHEHSGIELHEVASGYRLQAKTELSPWLAKLWEERPPRYTRAFLETLAIIAYKQPITRAEIEEIRGVTVSTNIMKTLSEREWIRVLGFRDTPGKPALYGTTKTFLDYFSLASLTNLPTLAEFKDMQTHDAELQVQLAIENSNIGPDNSEVIPEEREAVLNDETAEAEAGTNDEITAQESETSEEVSDQVIETNDESSEQDTESSDEASEDEIETSNEDSEPETDLSDEQPEEEVEMIIEISEQEAEITNEISDEEIEASDNIVELDVEVSDELAEQEFETNDAPAAHESHQSESINNVHDITNHEEITAEEEMEAPDLALAQS